MKGYVMVIALSLFVTTSDALAQESLLGRVPELQNVARLANSGALGCGVGAVTLITSRGRVDTYANSDALKVFGRTISVTELLPLLEARAEWNRTGAKNPMSGEVSDLTYVVLYTLSLAKDPDSVSVISELLKDKDGDIRGWAAIALYSLGESDDGLRARIQVIEFPLPAVNSAKSRGVEPPAWVRIAPGRTGCGTVRARPARQDV